MSKYKFVKDYIEEAKFRIQTANLALKQKRYNSAVRESHIIVELSSKALLLRWNFAVPKTHKVSSDLEDAKDLFSEEFKKEFNFITKTAKRLRREYEISLYGDEETDKSPSDLYTKDQTQSLIKDATKFYEICKKELDEFLNKTDK